MQGTRAGLIAAEDVLLFVNAAITATGQREFRSDAAEQHLSLDFLHAYVHGNYRDLYAATLSLDINDHNAARIILRLLRTAGEAGPEQRRTEGRLIARRLTQLPPPRVYRLFADIRAAGINNRRTRAIIRDWLSTRPDQAFDAVKYRTGLKTAARHAHLPGSAELGDFLFAPTKRVRYAPPPGRLPPRPLRAGRALRAPLHHRRGLRRQARHPAPHLPGAHRAAPDPS